MMKRVVEIDTSQPFGSVQEAVSRFGGRRTSIPHHSFSPDVDHRDLGTLNVDKMDDHTAQLERVLITRERETLEVLKELEETKKLLEGLKVNPLQEEVLNMATPKMNSSGSYISAHAPKSPPSVSLDSSPPVMDLDQAKVNLNKTSIDLAVIRASVESLNKKMSEDIDVPNGKDMFSTDENQEWHQKKELITSRPDEDSQFSFEAEQFKKMVETSRYEVMKAMSEIEKTKVSIKMAEMRLDAARKIEEAAKAVEAITFAERNLNCENSSYRQLQPDEITLSSFQNYSSHVRKAQEVEEICKTKFIDGNGMRHMRRETHYSEAASRKLMQRTKATYKNDHDSDDGFLGGRSNFHDIHPSGNRKDRSLQKHSESHPVEEQIDPVYRSTTSIGDILSRKLVLQDDFVAENHAEEVHDERQDEATLSQMIREQSGLIFRHVKSMKDGRRVRHFFAEKKKFGFIHVVLPKNRNKKNRPCS
ncbi:hypothetical protein LIER_02743 [Lithospermum erythrorhizon]|uniref:WEB family protein n=1 Tax=Lithospermum erythrorhizon TaxID=34254 RepID=A0AAV3NRR3_LITER